MAVIKSPALSRHSRDAVAPSVLAHSLELSRPHPQWRGDPAGLSQLSSGEPRRSLPSLNALHVFEAVARHGSFTAAAVELEVTQSAASRQISNLEKSLGISLFWRTTRQVELTEQGRFYADIIRGALNRIDAGTQDLLAGRNGTGELTISLPAGFGRWFATRLVGFRDRHPDINLVLVRDDPTQGEMDPAVDIAITFGRGNGSSPWADGVVERLLDTVPVPVCSPALVYGEHPMSVEKLSAHPLLQLGEGPDPWRRWFARFGIPAEALTFGPTFKDPLMAVQAAVGGMGIALLSDTLVEAELASGSLVAPVGADESWSDGSSSYYLVYPQAKADLQRVEYFRRWLFEEVRQIQSGKRRADA